MRISRTNRSAVSRARTLDWTSHSQATNTRHPSSSSRATTRSSLATFRSNFSCQKVVLDFGVVAMLHSGCRCQKHPWTKTIARCRGKTRSGFPGNFLLSRVNRSPRLCSSRRRVSSGDVFDERICAILWDRSSGDRKSTILQSVICRLPTRRTASRARCPRGNQMTYTDTGGWPAPSLARRFPQPYLTDLGRTTPRR